MAIADVLAKITFTDYSAAGKTTLENSIKALYAGSATARGILDKIANNATNFEIKHVADNAFVPHVAGTDTPDYIVRIDDDFADDYRFIDQNGNGVQVTTTRVLIHEIIHAVEKLKDNYNLTDEFQGATVDLTNKIMRELGGTTDRISYTGVAGDSIIKVGTNYSNGNAVDGAFVVNGALDMSGNAAATSDIMFGTNGANNNFNGGGKADYLYGRDGNDVLTGGAANDFLDGGTGLDVATYSGKCSDYTVTKNANGTYTVQDNRANSPDGTDTVKNTEYALFSDGYALFDENGIACPGDNIVLAVDVSGSMGDDIAAVKASASAIVDAMFGTDAAPIQSRFAIVTFNDTGAFRTHLSFTNHLKIADRKAAAQAAINSLAILGGGAEPLNAAVLSALNGGVGTWLANMRSNKVIVFSDEPAADPQLRPQVVAAAAALNVNQTQQLSPPPSSSSSGNFFEHIQNPITVQQQTGTAEASAVIIGSSSRARSDLEDLAAQTGGTTVQATDASEVVNALLQVIAVQTDFTGTDQPDQIVANSADNTISGLQGDDEILPGTGVDTISGGEGADTIKGTAADLLGDTLNDFTSEDLSVFTGANFGRDDITVTLGSAVLDVDTDGDGSADGTVTMAGDFTGGDFMAVPTGPDVHVSFETFLPALAEAVQVAESSKNGVNNQTFLTGDGSRGYKVTVDNASIAANNNSLGVYEIDASGNLVDVRLLFNGVNDSKSSSAMVTGVEDGNRLGFFLVESGADWANALAQQDTLSFINTAGTSANLSDGADLLLAVNGAATDLTVFHSFDAAMNGDGLQHVLSGVVPGGLEIQMGFEDLVGGGDNDYQDAVLTIGFA